MKTLNEVINALENVALADTDGESEGYFLAVDALHYLKEYRTILPLLPSLINTAIAMQKKGKTIG